MSYFGRSPGFCEWRCHTCGGMGGEPSEELASAALTSHLLTAHQHPRFWLAKCADKAARSLERLSRWLRRGAE